MVLKFNKSEKFKCEKCSRLFNNKWALQRHHKSHETLKDYAAQSYFARGKGRKWVCTICGQMRFGKKAADKEDVIEHIEEQHAPEEAARFGFGFTLIE